MKQEEFEKTRENSEFDTESVTENMQTDSEWNREELEELKELESLEDEEKDGKNGKSSFLAELLIYVIIVAVCLFIIPKYVVQRTVVDGTSMLNTLKDGDNVMVEKISYRLGEPDRFDIIVFYPYGRDEGSYYVKRIIGLPGETIQIVGDDIYIDGEILEEDYGKEPMTYSGIAKEPIQLADDEYFVLGDNRGISKDSRYDEVGPVKKELIEGKVIFRMYPFDAIGTVD